MAGERGYGVMFSPYGSMVLNPLHPNAHAQIEHVATR